MEPGLIPGCINISPCWFQQGWEDPGKQFIPEVSGTLKGNCNLSSIMDIQQLAFLSSAALQVMHPQLYRALMSPHIKLGLWAAEQGQDEMYRCLQHWASAYTGAAVVCNRDTPCHHDLKYPLEGFDILTLIGSYDNAVMNLTNLGIDLAYNPGVMVSYSGRLVRHGIQVSEGDRIIWAWFMWDSMHNHAQTPCTEYAKYSLADFMMYHLARYNQADFIQYWT
ncbi:uncharacterized protein F5891DRAFT_961807 [Suillus fuscotomentosus]|uniref:2OGFeDO JBP1/TET oxygenase domain-containing protein n=1 Tax=Suillus fuscotomentosus TaxID=1912939 RepID=A0AAD4DUV2_9AGAM|nr:uncharacterized protein F5891DRAFT_961807 [Suillus fuscotomentosus]KAG1894249.1 hypothetical protein F5891DRAFT_961807 [Suillus fuscotomentosus]